MKLPYTKEQSEHASRVWKARCGHHSIAAATGRTLEAVRTSGIKLCGWMNPTMIAQSLDGMKAPFVLHKLPPLDHPYLALIEENYHPSQILRVQFLGPWMNGPTAYQYQFTHYIACVDGQIMDPITNPCFIQSAESWIDWAGDIYTKGVPNCTGFKFTHAWAVERIDP